MVSIKLNLRTFVTVAAVVLWLFSTNALAFAQQPGDTEPPVVEGGAVNVVPGGPGFVSIPARAFKPQDEGGAWNWVNGDLAMDSDSSTGRFDAPLYIPNRARITNFILYYYDTSHDIDVSVYLYRKPLAGGFEEELARVHSWYEPGYGYYTDDTISYPEIDMQNYVYSIQVFFPGPYTYGDTLRLVGVRVDYGYDTYLSLIKK